MTTILETPRMRLRGALACRDLAFDRFDLQRVIGIVDPKNVASIRVAEKIGMEREREALVEGCPSVIYAAERPFDRDHGM